MQHYEGEIFLIASFHIAIPFSTSLLKVTFKGNGFK